MLKRSDYFEKPDALVTAALVGDFEAGQILLAQGIDPNVRDDQGRSALMVAIQEGWGGSHWAELLAQHGADINLVDEDGDSALDLARHYGQVETADFLVSLGAKSKNGPSAKQLRDDEVYRAFDHADAVKKLVAQINDKRKS